jgi:Domain of unknown function (DUF4411)
MIYVLDTNVFKVLSHYYPGTFLSLWNNLDDLVDRGLIISVREVFDEVEAGGNAEFVVDWAKKHKKIFLMPGAAETSFVAQIFAVSHFQGLVSQQALLRGNPVADPFVIAAGKTKSATVVTQEKLKPNSPKIPNVCKHFGINCVDTETFLTQQGWRF